MELGGKLVHHLFAISIKENGKRINRIASGYTQFILKVEQYSKNLDIWPNGSSCGSPLNGEFWIIWIIAGLISKLFAATAGLTIGVWSPCILGLTKSHMVLWPFWGFWNSCCLGGSFSKSLASILLGECFEMTVCFFFSRTVFSSSKSSGINSSPYLLALHVCINQNNFLQYHN